MCAQRDRGHIRQAMRLKGVADPPQTEHELSVADRARLTYVRHLCQADPRGPCAIIW